MTMIIDLEYIFWETLTVANYRKTPAKRIVQDLFEITANHAQYQTDPYINSQFSGKI